MKFTGIVKIADVADRVGNIYPRRVLEIAVEKYASLIEAKRSVGELQVGKDYIIPEIIGISISNVSHLTTDLYFEDNNLYAEISVLETNRGKVLRSLLDTSKIRLTMAGVGSINNNIVNEDFEILSINAESIE